MEVYGARHAHVHTRLTAQGLRNWKPWQQAGVPHLTGLGHPGLEKDYTPLTAARAVWY